MKCNRTSHAQGTDMSHTKKTQYLVPTTRLKNAYTLTTFQKSPRSQVNNWTGPENPREGNSNPPQSTKLIQERTRRTKGSSHLGPDPSKGGKRSIFHTEGRSTMPLSYREKIGEAQRPSSDSKSRTTMGSSNGTIGRH